MAFIEFRGWAWPDDAPQLLRTSILDVQAFKDAMAKHGGAPKTINRRISSLSSFYKFLSGAAAELRLPITVPNPAHPQFIAREASDPVEETRALSETRARQLMAMVTGESLLELRDRAILKFYLYSGARIETGCALNGGDFHQDGDEATVRFQLKGNRSKTKGIHFAAADAIAEYIRAARIESGPLFRPLPVPPQRRTGGAATHAAGDVRHPDGISFAPAWRDAGTGSCWQGRKADRRNGPGPHIFSALHQGTTATLLLDAREPIESVQDLLDHKHITTTQIYDKRRRSVRDSASHKVPI